MWVAHSNAVYWLFPLVRMRERVVANDVAKSCPFVAGVSFAASLFNLYGGQLTLSTQITKPNYLVILHTDAAPRLL